MTSVQTIRAQLFAAFAVMLCLAVAGGVAGLRYAGFVHDRLEHVYGDQLLAIKVLDEQRLALYRVERAARRWQSAQSRADRRAFAEEALRELDAVTSASGEAATASPGPVEQKLRDAFGRAQGLYAAAMRQRLAPEDAPAQTGADEETLFRQVDDRLAELVELNKNNAQTNYEYAKVDRERIFAWMAGSLAAAFIVGLLLAVGIVRGISGRLEEAVALVERVARGDLTGVLARPRGDEIGRLTGSMAAMVGGLIAMLRDIRRSTGAIHLATNEIASGSLDLSQRTERQVVSSDELAATTRSLAQAARANAVCAHDAIGAAAEAARRAEDGTAAVDHLAQCMSAIGAGAQRIGDVTHVIDSIAFKTNMLAVNAAVEAAHAKEHGRGFAVVAGEVRALAKHAAQQSREINALIGGSAREVELAGRHAVEARAAIEAVAASVKSLGEAMRGIAAASGEQLAVTERISDSTAQAGEDINRNAALAEQTTAMSAALREETSRLNELIGLFKLPAETGAAGAAAPSSSPSPSLPARPEPRLLARRVYS